jgi:hypothetical protein
MKETLFIIFIISVLVYASNVMYEIFNSDDKPPRLLVGTSTLAIYVTLQLDVYIAILLILFQILYLVVAIPTLIHYKQNKRR